eukprot:RCo039319
MFGVLYVRWAYVLWPRCYVQLEEAEGVLRVAPYPTSKIADRIQLSEMELHEPSPHRLTLISRTTGHLRADTTEQRAEWAASILALQKGTKGSSADQPSSRLVRFGSATVIALGKSATYCIRRRPQEGSGDTPPSVVRSALRGGSNQCFPPGTPHCAKYIVPDVGARS